MYLVYLDIPGVLRALPISSPTLNDLVCLLKNIYVNVIVIDFSVSINVDNKLPFSVSYFGGITVNTLPFEDKSRVNYFTSRLAFVNELLIARKFSNNLSLQLMGLHVHKNLVKRVIDQNDAFAAGLGGRFKFTQRMSVNAEYYYVMPGQTAKDCKNSLSVGVDLETGGHVFQLFLTNSQPLFERGFITETQGNWSKGEIYFGFNIIRTFSMAKSK